MSLSLSSISLSLSSISLSLLPSIYLFLPSISLSSLSLFLFLSIYLSTDKKFLADEGAAHSLLDIHFYISHILLKIFSKYLEFCKPI
jgi:hypothetical protein